MSNPPPKPEASGLLSLKIALLLFNSPSLTIMLVPLMNAAPPRSAVLLSAVILVNVVPFELT